MSQTGVVQPKNWNAALLKPMRMRAKPASARLHPPGRPIRQVSCHHLRAQPLGGTITLKVLVKPPVHEDGPAFHMMTLQLVQTHRKETPVTLNHAPDAHVPVTPTQPRDPTHQARGLTTTSVPPCEHFVRRTLRHCVPFYASSMCVGGTRPP